MIRVSTADDAEHLASLRLDAFQYIYPTVVPGVTEQDVERAVQGFRRDAIQNYGLLLEPTNAVHGWVAERDDRVVGIITAQRSEHEVELNNLFVSSTAQRRGIGRALTSHALEWAGYNRLVHLRVVAANAGAIRLYESLGFELAGMPSEGTFPLQAGGKPILSVSMVRQAR